MSAQAEHHADRRAEPPPERGCGPVCAPARGDAELDLHHGELRYRGLVDALPDAVMVFENGRLALANPACLVLFGAESADDLLGRTPAELFQAVGQSRLPTLFQALPGLGRPPLAVEETLLRPDGRAVEVEVTMATLGDPAGGMIHVILRDISERNARNADLQRLIRMERARSRINQVLLYATAEAELLQAACQIVVEECGYAMMWIGVREGGRGRPVRPSAWAGADDGYLAELDQGLGLPGWRGEPSALARRAGEAGFCNDLAVGAEDSPWRMAALARGFAAAAGFPLLNARGDVLGVIGLYARIKHPFTREESKLLGSLSSDLALGLHALRLRVTHAETEAAMAALRNEFQQLVEWQVASQTAAAIAHEIGQPLNAVTTFGEAALRLLDQLSPRPEKLARAIEGMAAQAERAGHVVRELMQFLRQAEVTLEDLDLVDLAERAADMARASFPGVGRIVVGGPPDLPAVRGNRLQIEKVLLNLLGNGTDAMREAGLKGRDAQITLRLAADGSKALVTVSDTGPGVAPADRPHLFEPFFTTKAKGLGMGLAISRALIEAQGGRLWHEAVPGAGATFHFSLPFAP